MRSTGLLLIVPLLAAAAGCDTVTSDLSDIAGAFVPTSPGEAARMAVDQNDPDRRREGLILLAGAYFGGEPRYVDLYREYAEHDGDPIARAVAIRSLARHGTAEDAGILAANLEHENAQVRREAARGLQRLHDPAVVPALLRVLADEEEQGDVREAVARGLGQYPQDRVFQALVAALDARELAVNVAARHSLRDLTGEDFDDDAAAWLRWYGAAQRAGTSFTEGLTYRYPVYTRGPTFLERLAFWNRPVYEQPGVPAGLEDRTRRRTWDEEPPTEDG